MSARDIPPGFEDVGGLILETAYVDRLLAKPQSGLSRTEEEIRRSAMQARAVPGDMRWPGQLTPAQLNNWFTYHAPNEAERQKYQRLREKGYELAYAIISECPPGPDTTAAVRKVREAIMTANAAIACGGT